MGDLLDSGDDDDLWPKRNIILSYQEVHFKGNYPSISTSTRRYSYVIGFYISC